MYDELVKRLRHSANFAERGLTPPPSELCAAADAIEELTALSSRQEVELVELTGELASKPRWIPVEEDTPGDFISVQAHMTDAGNFPSVREAYVVNKNWFFPALKEFHPVDMWKRFDEPPEEE